MRPFRARIFPPKSFKPAFPCNFPRVWVDGDDTSILYPGDWSLWIVRVAPPGPSYWTFLGDQEDFEVGAWSAREPRERKKKRRMSRTLRLLPQTRPSTPTTWPVLQA